jgi:hypothetical protein
MSTVGGGLPATGERIEGRPLRKLLEESGHLDWQDVADLGIQLSEELEARHQRDGRAHRLVMPETIFRTRDGLGYRLADSDAAAGFRRGDLPVGSEEYRAPEEWRTPNAVDARADQFGLGVVLHEALAGNGKRPFDVVIRPPRSGDGVSAAYTPRHDLRVMAPDAPEGLIRVIEHATRLNPNNRYGSCAQLAAALRAVLEPPAASEWAAPAEPPRRLFRRLALAVLVVALVAVAGYVASTLLVRAPGRDQMEHARQDAERAQAPQFASTLWRQAEMYQPSEANKQRRNLYTAARDAAWKARLASVVDAARQAVELGATGEESFQLAEVARTQAQQQWTAGELAEASQSLTVADAGFRNAVAARRTQWAGRIQQTLSGEVAKLPNGNKDTVAVDAVKRQQAVILRVLEDPQASSDELRHAEQSIGEVEAKVAVLVEKATAVAEARRNAETAVAAAERARRAVEKVAETSQRTRDAYDHGVEVLVAARAHVDDDAAHAALLAGEAALLLRKVDELAEVEVAAQHRAAADAQRRARARSGGAVAANARVPADDGDSDDDDSRIGLPHSKPPPAAVQARTGNMAGPDTAARPIAPPPVVAALPPKPQEPMSPALAQEIQSWMSGRCEDVNRELESTHNSRARCENLNVLDRQDIAQVKVSYVLTVGARKYDGWQWQAPEQRRPVLDCSGGHCRCVSGC